MRGIRNAVAAALLVAAAATAAAGDSPDPCEGWNTGPTGARPVADMFACFDTIAFNSTVAANTGKSVSRAMEIYVFADIANAPPAESRGLEVQAVHLQQEIGAITKSAEYTTDYDMQADLTALFRRLQDAHTRYILPANYGSFSVILPLNLWTLVDEATGRQEVRASPLGIPASAVPLLQKYMPDADKLLEARNATVLTIQGEPALPFLTRFANESVGLSKDLGTRLNLASAFYEANPTGAASVAGEIASSFTVRSGDWSPFPPRGEDSVRFEFLLDTGATLNLTLPWLAFVSRDTFYDTDSFRDAWLSDDPPAGATAAAAAERALPSLDFAPRPHPLLAALDEADAASDAPEQRSVWRDDRPPLPQRNPETGACTGSSYCFELLAESPSVRFYRIVGDDRTVVLYWNTFAPQDDQAFQTAVHQGLAKAAALGLDRLIIDSTGNGGGDICLGRLMLKYIVDPDHNYGPTEMAGSELADALAQQATTVDVEGGIWEPSSYVHDNGTAFSNTSTEWLTGGPTHTRGGLTRKYSQLMHLSDSACSYDAELPAMPRNFSEVIIATHGLCGSTCALFVDHAALYDHVKTVAVGGVKGRPMQYTSFPGLQVYDTPALWSEMESYFPNGGGDSVLPPRLITSARYRMCGRQIYPHAGAPAPTEYTFLEADHHLDATFAMMAQPEFVWFEVAKLFGQEQ